MEIDWIRQALADRRLSVVAARTGISEPTLRMVRMGRGNPTLATIEKIAAYLKADGQGDGE